MSEYLLYFSKETENKVRWDQTFDDVLFELYIPRWRVHEPIPAAIKVSLFLPPLPEPNKAVTPKLAVSNSDLCKLPILSHVKWHSNHSNTVRYDPIGDSDIWEIGSPYIPYSLLQDSDVETILICVQWV
jgi:hypothetical protein